MLSLELQLSTLETKLRLQQPAFAILDDGDTLQLILILDAGAYVL